MMESQFGKQVVFLLLFVFIETTSSQDSSLYNQPFDLKKFRIPVSKASYFLIRFSNGFQGNKQENSLPYDSVFKNVSNQSDKNSNSNLDFGLNYFKFFDSEDFAYSISLSNSNYLFYQHRNHIGKYLDYYDFQTLKNSYQSESNTDVNNFSTYFNCSGRYLKFWNLFFIDGMFNSSGSSYWIRSESDQRDQAIRYDSLGIPSTLLRQRVYKFQEGIRYNIRLSPSIGLGYGKIRDVTDVIRAIRINEKLKEAGAMKGNFSEKEILEIAQLLTRQEEYQVKYSRFTKYWYRDIENYIQATGKVDLHKMNFFTAQKFREAIDENIPYRFSGIQLSTNLKPDYQIEGSYRDYYYSLREIERLDTISTSIKYPSRKNDRTVWYYQMQISFYYPLSLTYQFNHYDLFERTLNTNQRYFSRRFSSSTELTYRIGERWQTGLSYHFNYSRLPLSSYDWIHKIKSLAHSLDLSFQYFIEERIMIFGIYQYLNYKYEFESGNLVYYNNGYERYPNRSYEDHSLSFGISYSLWGGSLSSVSPLMHVKRPYNKTIYYPFGDYMAYGD